MLNDEELAAIVQTGYEPRGIERKRGQPLTDGDYVATIARAAMALANQRDGGHILLGVEDDDRTGERSGLSPDLVGQWLVYDTVVDQLNRYADPPLRIDIAELHLPSGASIVAIQVAEFDQIPIICRRDRSRKLQAGAIYTRSMAKPESSAAITQNELRELLNLATEKQLARFLDTASRAGLNAATDRTDPHDVQIAAFEQDTDLIQSAPRLQFAIRPDQYEPERINYGDLLPLISRLQVRQRGWPLPYIQQPCFGDDWVGEQDQHFEATEAWRLHENGLFLFAQTIPTHYRQEWPRREDTDGSGFPAWLPVTFLTEALTLASRLQRAIDPDHGVRVDVAAERLAGWTLIAANPRRAGFHSAYTYTSPNWRRTVRLSPQAALTDVNATAATAAENLLRRFGWQGVTQELVRGMQEEIFGSAV